MLYVNIYLSICLLLGVKTYICLTCKDVKDVHVSLYVLLSTRRRMTGIKMCYAIKVPQNVVFILF